MEFNIKHLHRHEHLHDFWTVGQNQNNTQRIQTQDVHTDREILKTHYATLVAFIMMLPLQARKSF